MEAASLLIVGTTYLGSLVARKCADDAVEELLARVKTLFRREEGRELTAADAGGDALARLLSDSELKPLLDAFFQSSTALQRAVGSSTAFDGAEILWCDDFPDNNEWERTLFEAFGARVTAVRSNEDAVRERRHHSFDLALSDIDRAGRPLGLELPSQLAGIGPTPVVFYVGHHDRSLGVPPGAHGITARPDELLHLVCDVMQRTAG